MATNGQTATPQVNDDDHPRKSRRLILCFDGTSNLFDSNNTNVVGLTTFLRKDDYRNQMVYYQPGVGTYIREGWSLPFMKEMAKLAAEGVAWDIPYHIMGGYTFLMQNWVPGDRIYLFGFSRGAYTARALAGMLHKIGLLPRGNEEQVPYAFKMYKRTDKKGWEMSTMFKKAFCNPVDIDYVGVWDTVASVGVISQSAFPFTASDTNIRVFRHAMSLDERRVKFKVNHWHHTPSPTEVAPNAVSFWANLEKRGSKILSEAEQTVTLSLVDGGEPDVNGKGKPVVNGQEAAAATAMSPSTSSGSSTAVAQPNSADGSVLRRPSKGLYSLVVEDASGDAVQNTTQKTMTDVLEVWFAGGHGDVGGGCAQDTDEHAASRIPLVWMIRECVLTGTGIEFDEQALKNADITLPPVLKDDDHMHQQGGGSAGQPGETPPEQSIATLDGRYEGDVRSIVTDQLTVVWYWWILEVLPLGHHWEEIAGKWVNSWMPNMGHPRRVPPPPTKVHVSVKERMIAEGTYSPAAKWQDEPIWVD